MYDTRSITYSSKYSVHIHIQFTFFLDVIKYSMQFNMLYRQSIFLSISLIFLFDKNSWKIIFLILGIVFFQIFGKKNQYYLTYPNIISEHNEFSSILFTYNIYLLDNINFTTIFNIVVFNIYHDIILKFSMNSSIGMKLFHNFFL